MNRYYNRTAAGRKTRFSQKIGRIKLAKLTIPTVALDIYDETTLRGRKRNLVYISGSAAETGKCVAQHFLSQGIHRSYGFVGDLKGHIWSKLRGEAFIEAIRAAGLSVARYRVRGKGYDLPQLADWIRELPKPAAIFAADYGCTASQYRETHRGRLPTD